MVERSKCTSQKDVMREFWFRFDFGLSATRRSLGMMHQTGNASMITLSYIGVQCLFPRDPYTQLLIHLFDNVEFNVIWSSVDNFTAEALEVFSSDCPHRQVYDAGEKEVALSVVGGINSSVFAYGQTSSGKTYTMIGITEYAMADIYDYIQRHKEREFILKFSAMEIYNESVRDLLSADSTQLRLLDGPEGQLLRNSRKKLCGTGITLKSFYLCVKMVESSAREFLGNDKSSMLAATVTLSTGARLKEGRQINRSLLTLGTVIRKLSKGINGNIPFRHLKLTRILQSSLGGNARTAIIYTMSPARSHVEQSRNTLLFASCAKEVTTNAQVNVVLSDKALVKQLQRELARLDNELKKAGTASISFDSALLMREKDLEIEKLKKEVSILTRQIDLARSEAQISRNGSPSSLTSATEEMSSLKHEKELADQEVMKPVLHGSVKDIGLDPIPDTYWDSTAWSSEFKRLQREIIELWHACNVKHRRLSFLNNVFSHGNQTIENGRMLTPASCSKALSRERRMLSQQMSKRLSKAERKSLFLKCGVGLNMKHRRLQLAHRLWIDSKDMHHIAESAAIVAKLVGFVDPDKSFKEMFGLNFTPGKCTNKRNCSLKCSVMSIL
ncbi:V-type proton ATPase 16 kDa proteolipid subunit-like [Hibiscus syriacus]|uniref:V-type proton ATPase 16 kDa proteolipid subunit-like n=1 Tax=Hibiscus syriacus TaxID=106335 RepID=A0A6A2ZSV4_HIBSY|nr:V-type proton ATPase 16 kDa proteolipid subunit-like [Hibiscus syriacus]